MVVPFLMMTRKKVRTRRGQEKSPPMSETKCQWGNKIETWAKWNTGKLRIAGTDLREKNAVVASGGSCLCKLLLRFQTPESAFSKTSQPLYHSMGVLQFQKTHGVSPPLILRQGACNITKALETLKFSSWPGSMEWSHGQSFWEAFPVTQRLPQVDAFQTWIRCWEDLFGLQHGFPHWEEMVFGGSQNLGCFFLQIEVVFQQLNWIPSSHPDSVSIHFPMSCRRKVFAWNQATHLHQSGFRTNLQVSFHIQPFQTSGFQAATQDFWTIFCKERSRDPYKWPLYVYHF